MKISVAAVCSADGKLTRGNDPHITSWTSAEDKEHFKSLVDRHEVIIMGRKTYEAARHSFGSNPSKRRIVLTRTPQKFTDESSGLLEFTHETPDALIKRLSEEGTSQVLVAGGGEINAVFFKAGLVNELYLTIEPLIFGEGTPLAGNQPLQTSLQLLSSRQLNDNGSMLLHFTVK